MKKVSLYGVKLINGQIYRGEIIQKNDKAVWLRLPTKQTIRLSNAGIIVIKDLGWQEV